MTVQKDGTAPLAAVLMVAVGALGVFLYAMLDSMVPPFWLVVVYGAVWSLFLIPCGFWMAKRPWRGLYGAFWLSLLAVWVTPWNSVKAFRRDAQGVRPGMTVSQVEQRLGRWVAGVRPVTGQEYGWGGRRRGAWVDDPWSITDGEILIPGDVAYRKNPEVAAYLSADCAVVTIAKGRVVRAEFIYD